MLNTESDSETYKQLKAEQQQARAQPAKGSIRFVNDELDNKNFEWF